MPITIYNSPRKKAIFPSAEKIKYVASNMKGITTPTSFSSFFVKNLLHPQSQNILHPQTHKTSIRKDYLGENYTFLLATDKNSGLSSYRVEPKGKSPKIWIVHFPGNGQNALDKQHMERLVQESPEAGHVFFNYPEIGSALDSQFNAEDWKEAAYLHVMKLIKDKHIKDGSKIILDSWSLGCAMAANVAKRLYEQKIAVSLLMDRGFDASNTLKEQVKYHKTSPIKSYAVGMLLLGLAASIGTANSIASLGVLVGRLLIAIGELFNWVFSALANLCSPCPPVGKFFSYVGLAINGVFEIAAIAINLTINLLASAVGVLASIAAVSVGCAIGVVAGSLMSVAEWMGFKVSFPLEFAFSAFLKSLSLDLNPSSDLEQLVKTQAYQENPGRVTSINTQDDWVVRGDSALNARIEKSAQKYPGVKTLWFAKGNHGETLAEPIGDPHATHASLLSELKPK